MKKIILTLSLAFVAISAVWANDDKPIKTEELPVAAQEFLKAHFPNVTVSLVMEDTDFLFKEYEVVLADASRVEFDGDGGWKDVECKSSGVPAAIVPKQVSDYVAKHYADAKVVKIERDGRGFEVSLSNRLELTFDKNFRVIDIDD